MGGNNPVWNYREGIKSIRHRGPDGAKELSTPDFWMAFTRLAVIDLSSNGMQPMVSRDHKVVIVYNGEIYGYTRLKRELQKKYEFISSADTEVILYAYLEYGDKFVDKIDGMYAIAIYDQNVMQVKLFRDRAGIKPMYYYYDGTNFAFSSELKALVNACTTINFKIDYTAIYDYLYYQYIPTPKTMYQNCYKLPPAHKLIFDLSAKTIKSISKYWVLHVNTAKGKYRKDGVICDRLRELLEESVRDQLTADVPVGTFLSGGVDSSIITYISHKSNPDIQTFSIGFENPRYNEVQYARILADRYGINYTEKILCRRDIDAVSHQLNNWYDEPFADTSAYPSFVISKMAREKVTVVLTGDGGDELFGGYDRYQEYAELMQNKILDNRFVSEMSRRLGLTDLWPAEVKERFINTGLENYQRMIFLSNQKEADVYYRKWKIDKEYDVTWYLSKYYRKELPLLTRMRYLDFKTYLPDDILTKVDRVSMANSLEARVPFLSRKLIEFAFSLSEEECCTAQKLKRILKKAYQKEIPREILYREKKGFSVPCEYLTGRTRNQTVTAGILENEWQGI